LFSKKLFKGILLTATLALSSLGSAQASFADPDSTISSLSTGDGQPCLSTFAQEAENKAIDNNKVVYPMAKGTFTHTSNYGPRISPITGEPGEFHTGSDFAEPDKSPIYAIADGEVVDAGPTWYLGQWVVIKHVFDGKVYTSVYGHLTAGSQIVKKGDTVKAGQQIALEGSTGLSTGPHLHLEIWDGEIFKGKTIDPDPWLQEHNVGYLDDSPQYKSLTCGKGTLQLTDDPTWGNYKNGEIPNDKLCSLDFATDMKLECESADKLDALNKTFHANFGTDIPVVKSYLNLEDQKTKDDSLPGKSFFGWARSIEINFTTASNDYIPLVSEPNYFTDAKYLWLAKNGREFGWGNPTSNQQNGTDPNARLWIYNPNINAASDIPSLINFAVVNSIAYPWYNSKNTTCLTDLWSKESSWNMATSNPNGSGIPVLSDDAIKSLGVDKVKYSKDAQLQVQAGLMYVNKNYPTPCVALDAFNTNGKY
jgi:hypothetical protein